MQQTAPQRNFAPPLSELDKFPTLEFPYPHSFFEYLNSGTNSSRRNADNLVKDLYLSFDLKINLGNKNETGTGGGKN